MFTGVVQGVGVGIRSAREVNTRRAGINGSTEISLRAAAPAAVTFSVEMSHGPSVQTPDTVWTGDMPFTGLVRTRSDDVPAARAWLAGAPPLRAAIVATVQKDGGPVRVVYAHGDVRVQLPFPLWDEPRLDRAIALALAAAHARLA